MISEMQAAIQSMMECGLSSIDTVYIHMYMCIYTCTCLCVTVIVMYESPMHCGFSL